MTKLEIGRIGKAHGLKGEVTARLTSDRAERTSAGAVWYLDAGPITVVSAKPFQERWIARLEGVATREDAQALTGQVIWGEPIDDPDALWIHELVGSTVATPDGNTWGEVVAVLANPADDLLELADGTLIPVGFISDATALPGRVEVTVPDGLLGATD